jgi:hypothetical protein
MGVRYKRCIAPNPANQGHCTDAIQSRIAAVMRLPRSFAITALVVIASCLSLSAASRAEDSTGVAENVYRTTLPGQAPALGATEVDTWEA